LFLVLEINIIYINNILLFSFLFLVLEINIIYINNILLFSFLFLVLELKRNMERRRILTCLG